MKVLSIDSRHLKKILRKESGKCLILDCRPYLAFASSSVRGSVNVNLNSVVVRRSRGAPVPLRFVVPDEEALFRLREGGVSVVVALDEGTPHLHKLKKDSVARLAIHSLAHLTSCANICFLKGERFNSLLPKWIFFKISSKTQRSDTNVLFSLWLELIPICFIYFPREDVPDLFFFFLETLFQRDYFFLF